MLIQNDRTEINF